MSRILLLTALVGAIWFWWNWRNTSSVQGRKDLIWKTAVGGLLIAIFLLALAGRIHWLGAVVAGLLPLLKQGIGLLIRNFPFFAHVYKTHGPTAKAPNTSTVSSTIIEMTLNHENGELQGKVLDGPFTGQQLSALTRDDCVELLNYCRRQDSDSARLLESYLTQRFAGDENFGAEEDNGTEEQSESNSPPMNAAEALAILGVEAAASDEEITLAHRRLIQKLHPDRGGNDYLAAKINQARDLLLNRHV